MIQEGAILKIRFWNVMSHDMELNNEILHGMGMSITSYEVVYCFLYSIVSFHWDPRPLFTKQGEISPPNFVKSGSREIGFKRI